MKTIFTTLFSLILFLSALAPLASATGQYGDSHDRPETADLLIHKVQFNDADIPEIENHDGTPITGLGDGPLAGAQFTIYRVADDLAAPPTDYTGLTAFGPQTTGADGIAKFEALPAGRYLVVETGVPHGVNNYYSPPFLVDVPMTNPAGDGWLDEVHVYAKNQLILGSVSFKKWFEALPDVTATATFSIYHAIDGVEVLLGTATTDADGLVYFDDGGKGLETGNYMIRETSVSDPYGLNADPIPFTVGLNDHDNDLTDRIASVKPLTDTYKNYTTITEPEKENTDADDDDNSADLGEIVNWEMSARIPLNIGVYEMFKMTDILDSRLDFVPGSVTITVDGVAVAATITAPTTTSGGTLIIDFNPATLAAHAGKRVVVSFDTKINATAVMGEDIPNKFTLDFDNGPTTYTKESPTDVTKTGGAKFLKTSNEDAAKLDGAEFWIYKFENDIKYYLQDDYTWATEALNTNPMVLTSDDTGYFDIKGLAFGNYFLEERKALMGHALRPDYPFDVDATTYDVEIPQEVLNTFQIELPSTGGMGTIAFTIAGLGLMMVATRLYRKEETE